MTAKIATVLNKAGLHARPAAMMIAAARGFASAVAIEKGGLSVGVQSIVWLLRLQVKQGDQVIVRADGVDEEAAAAAIVQLIDSKFGEE